MVKRSETTHPNRGAFPAGVPGPALRALSAAGVSSLEQLAGWSEAELLALHGMGPKAIGLLRAGLEARGLRFAESPIQ